METYSAGGLAPDVHLDYAGIRGTNLARTKRFLVRALGLVEVRRGRTSHGGVWVLFREPTSHQRLELNRYPKGSKYATPLVAGEGLDHLGVRVQDLAAARKQLLAGGPVLLRRSGGAVGRSSNTSRVPTVSGSS